MIVFRVQNPIDTVHVTLPESIKNLYETMKIEFSELLSSKWNLEILDFIFTYPVFRNSKFVSSTGIPPASVASIVKKLIESGYLLQKEEASGRRSALYSFEPLMQLVRV